MIGSPTIADLEFGDAHAETPGKTNGLFGCFNKHLSPALKIIGHADMKMLGE
jgi:hypothetical protein